MFSSIKRDYQHVIFSRNFIFFPQQKCEFICVTRESRIEEFFILPCPFDTKVKEAKGGRGGEE